MQAISRKQFCTGSFVCLLIMSYIHVAYYYENGDVKIDLRWALSSFTTVTTQNEVVNYVYCWDSKYFPIVILKYLL